MFNYSPSLYDINLDKIAQDFLPLPLRKPVLLAFIKTLLYPIEEMKQEFLAYRLEKLKEVSYTSSTLMLERMLNDNYPDASAPIYIENTINLIETAVLYSATEAETAVIYSEAEATETAVLYSTLDTTPYDFTVFVPSDLTYNADELKALVKMYCLAGKRFQIIEF